MLAQVTEQLSPEHITAFKDLSPTAIIVIFLIVVVLMIPTFLASTLLVMKHYTKALKTMSDAFMHALNKRDEDQKKIVETLDKMGISIDRRLVVLENKVDKLVIPPSPPPLGTT